MGFRSGSEIDHERLALKVLRGDFRHLPTVQESENKDDIARLEGEGGIALDPRFLVEMSDGQRPHQLKLASGDASSDSFCFAA